MYIHYLILIISILCSPSIAFTESVAYSEGWTLLMFDGESLFLSQFNNLNDCTKGLSKIQNNVPEVRNFCGKIDKNILHELHKGPIERPYRLTFAGILISLTEEVSDESCLLAQGSVPAFGCASSIHLIEQ